MKHRCIICLILVSQGKSLFTENKSLFPFYLLLSLIPLQPSISKYKLTVNIFKLATQLQGMGTRNRGSTSSMLSTLCKSPVGSVSNCAPHLFQRKHGNNKQEEKQETEL